MLQSLGKISPDLHGIQQKGLEIFKPHQLSKECQDFKRFKEQFLVVGHMLETNDTWTDSEKQRLVDGILSLNGLINAVPEWLLVDKKGKGKNLVTDLMGSVIDKFPWGEGRASEAIRRAKTAASVDELSDPIFIQKLPGMCDKEPFLLKAAVAIGTVARNSLKGRINRLVAQVCEELHRTEIGQIRDKLRRKAKAEADNEKIASRGDLIKEINGSYGSEST